MDADIIIGGDVDSSEAETLVLTIIPSEAAMLEHLEAKDREQANRHVYKYTDCGAWIEFEDDGIKIGSIVEGCDFGTAVYPLKYPFTSADYDARMKLIEEEADALWKWANEEDCEGEAPSFFQWEFVTDGRSA